MAKQASRTKHTHVRWDRLLMAAALLAALLLGLRQIFRLSRSSQSAELPAQETIPASTTAAAVTPLPSETEGLSQDETISAATQPETEPVEIPESILLEVPYISQKGLLPTGCELVSAKMLMEYYGVTVDINKIIENTASVYPKAIDGRSYAPSPYEAFIGSPWDETSFGCFPPVIVEMMNKLLPEGLTAVDTTGTELQVLAETYLPREMPVLVWATISMLETYPGIPWYLLDENGNTTDEIYYWPANEHCLVLVGYDSANYYFNDPYGGRGLVSYSRELVESRFADIGKFSVVVLGA